MNRKYIPKNLRKSLGRRCQFPACRSPSCVFHHPTRHVYGGKRLVPLCKIHHEFAHLGLIANEQLDVEKWKLRNLAAKPLQFDADKQWEIRRRPI